MVAGDPTIELYTSSIRIKCHHTPLSPSPSHCLSKPLPLARGPCPTTRGTIWLLVHWPILLEDLDELCWCSFRNKEPTIRCAQKHTAPIRWDSHVLQPTFANPPPHYGVNTQNTPCPSLLHGTQPMKRRHIATMLSMSWHNPLQPCPHQRWLKPILPKKKTLLSTLGIIYQVDFCLMTFYLDWSAPQLPRFVASQILVTIKNMIIHRCIVDEGAST